MKKLVSILLAALLVLSCLPLFAFADDTPVGYATVSIVDNGDRDYLMAMGDLDEDEIEYAEPFGVIVPETQVPVYAGDTMAGVLVRLFDMEGITYTALGDTTLTGGFYLQNITFTDSTGALVENFGEGSITPDDDMMYYFSGWMATLNNWFTDKNISAFPVEDGDVIRLLYTCGMGADIGSDFYNATAALTGLNVSAGTLSPAFSADVKAYTLTVDENTDSVKLSAENANYNSVVTYTVGEVTYKYMRAIPVVNGTVIVVNSKFYTTDYSTGESTLADEDEITVTVVKPEPVQPDGSKSVLDYIREGWELFSGFFKTVYQRLADFFQKLFK